MTLTDAGPLIAVIDRGEAAHQRCVEALRSLRSPLVTTWPAFTEAMYLLGTAAGWTGQEALWRLVGRGDLQIASTDGALIDRARDLMERYRDTPMDLADATLVALAEVRGFRRIFSLDRDFLVYRTQSGKSLKVVP